MEPEAMMGGESSNSKKQGKHKGKHDKPKPWDEDPNIDRWKVEKFDPTWNEGGLLEVSSFSTLFPQYRGFNFTNHFFFSFVYIISLVIVVESVHWFVIFICMLLDIRHSVMFVGW
jgi:hypothetical protein